MGGVGLRGWGGAGWVGRWGGSQQNWLGLASSLFLLTMSASSTKGQAGWGILYRAGVWCWGVVLASTLEAHIAADLGVSCDQCMEGSAIMCMPSLSHTAMQSLVRALSYMHLVYAHSLTPLYPPP